MVASMKTNRNFAAIIEREADGYVSLCPELDIASQGETAEEAPRNLAEALHLFFEHASETEIKERLRNIFNQYLNFKVQKLLLSRSIKIKL